MTKDINSADMGAVQDKMRELRFDLLVNDYKDQVEKSTASYKNLKDLDFFVLDNSIRESTVGQTKGHTLEEKGQIFEEVKKCGFKNIIVATFSQLTRVDDIFCRQLVESLDKKDPNRPNMYAFSEVCSGRKGKIPETEKIPIGLVKMKEYGLSNPIFQIDISGGYIDFDEYSFDDYMSLTKKWIVWSKKNLHKDCKVMINIRDLSDGMPIAPGRCFKAVDYLAKLPDHLRPIGILFEDSGGGTVPEECGQWAAFIRKVMDMNKWKGHLLLHVHEKYGFADSVTMNALMNGANGIWASVCTEGAAMGHSSSCNIITNLARLGNKKVLKKYHCGYLREAAINVTKITTGMDPHPKQPIYGERALDLVLEVGNDNFDLADFFGQEAPMRICTISTPRMVAKQLVTFFGEDPQFNQDMASKMIEVMLDDLRNNRKEEYMSHAGLAMLFDRAGGKLTETISEILAKIELKKPHHKRLINQVKQTWDEWDMKEEEKGDDCLEFDSFYHGFMVKYFGCYRCEDTRKAMQAIDMDNDGRVDWNEFMVYLMWALNEYPDIDTQDELIDVAFRKGLIPAMRDEILKQK